jgi:hypothetical protein
MADDTQVTGTPAVELATPPEPTSAQTTSATTEAAQETPVQPAYVTKAELEQMMTETLRRVKQSDRDRAKQTDDKLNAIRTRLETGGAQLTPSQVNVLREQIENESEVPAQAPASALTPEMKEQADYVYAQLDATFEDVGAIVTPNDPEYKAIKEALDDPKGSLAKVIRIAGKAAEAKAARVASQKENAAARTIGNGGSTNSDPNNISHLTDSAELYRIGDRAIRSKRK